MDRKNSAKVRKKNRAQLSLATVSNPEFVPIGIPSPKGALPPYSVSPVADSLQAFAENDGDGLETPGSVSLRLEECIGKSRRNWRVRPHNRGRKHAQTETENGDHQHAESISAPPETVDKDWAEVEDTTEAMASLDIENKLEEVVSGKEVDAQIFEQNSDYEPGPSEPEDLESVVLRKLMEQVKASDGPVLSEDEVSRNKQEQDDEILALEAIYERNFKLFNTKDGDLRTFMLNVSVEIAESIQVLMELQASTSESRSLRSTTSYNFTLQHLPPIHLACIFTTRYPSHSPPLFVLQAEWLNTEKLLHLSEKLDQIWEVQTGEVVVYPWAEFLHSQALPSIGASEKLFLEKPSNHERYHSLRVQSGCISPDADALLLLRHNEEMQLECFRNSFHLCSICFNESLGKDFIRFPCQHAYCHACMQQYASVHVTEGSVNKLNCPETNCSRSIPPHILKELLGEEAFERWERLSLQKTLDAMADVVYCPRCQVACIEDADHHAQCGECFFSFCSLCKATWHVGQQCLSPEARLRVLQERGKGHEQGEEQRRKEQDLVNQLQSLTVVKRDAIQCPSCQMAISKVEGCNKMTCSNCGQYFCFRCGKAIEGYDHFGSGSCVLFEQQEIDAWEQQFRHEFNPRQLLGQVRVELYPELARPCPACGQRNVKQRNNNHMFCWACQNHYCGLCLKLVRRAKEHFAPKKCKQFD